MTAAVSVVSREYVYSTVEPEGEDALIVNTLPVAMAFLLDAPPVAPADLDFKTGSWEPGTNNARCLIGPAPSAVTLPIGTYYAWLRINGAVERPIRFIGKVKVS